MSLPAELKPCSLCGFANLPRARFCGGCATPVTESAEAHVKERRWLTVLFCDIAGWSRLARRLGLEDASDVLDAYYQACTDVVQQHGGHVAQLLGDGVLAYFGYPIAHEDSAVRALRASVELVQRLGGKPITRQPGGTILDVRLGVLTGWVVVGVRGVQGEFLARGDTTNVAARLQAAASPNTVVTSELTHRMTRGLFAVEDLGTRPLDGVPEPVRLYRVDRYLGGEGRPQLPGSGVLTPFIGRTREADSLLASWGEAEKGRSRTVFLVGEAGIGKSRHLLVLTKEFALGGAPPAAGVPQLDLPPEQLALPPHRAAGAVRLFLSGARLRPLLPQAGGARELAHCGMEAHRGAARAGLAAVHCSRGGLLYALPELLPQKLRQATFEALRTWLSRLACAPARALRPGGLALGADPSTLQFIPAALAREPAPGVFTLLTSRPPP